MSVCLCGRRVRVGGLGPSSSSVKDGRSAGTGVLKCVSPIFGGDTPTRECAWMVKSMIKITPLLGK